jgi:glycosyltransferase involved in cell wall biosynthesis
VVRWRRLRLYFVHQNINGARTATCTTSGDEKLMGITVVLLNYSRPHNMHKLITSIRKQTVPTEIIFVNNSSYVSTDAELVISNSHNLGCYVRILAAHYASNQTVVFIDDDLAINDRKMFESLASLEAPITGAWGRNVDFTSEKPYSSQPDVQKGLCNVIKGRFMCFRKTILNQVPIGDGSQPDGMFTDDIYLSLMAGMGKPVHSVSEYIRGCLDELEKVDTGLCSRPTHYDNRDALCKWWYENHKKK